MEPDRRRTVHPIMHALFLLASCTQTPEVAPHTVEAPAPDAPGVAPDSGESYAEIRAALEAQRLSLAAVPRTAQVRSQARAALLSGVHDALIPAWYGTPWAFYGATQTPGEGAIACGYFVATVLRDAGLRVERVRLAQQASEHIVQTFSEAPHVQRFRTGDVNAVVDAVLEEPEGIYVVGLDYHVGLLVRRERSVAFCHSTVIDAAGVVCEDPRTSPGFLSHYHVFGPVLEDAVIDAWLDETEIRTVTP